MPPFSVGLKEAFGVSSIDDFRRITHGLGSDLQFRVVVQGAPYLLRIMTRMDERNDPTRIFACMNAAAEAGLAPRVEFRNRDTSGSLANAAPLHVGYRTPAIGIAELLQRLFSAMRSPLPKRSRQRPVIWTTLAYMKTALTRRTVFRQVLAGSAGAGLFAPPMAAAKKPGPLTASDKLFIMELAARFEKALDREDVESYLATFQSDGVLEGVGPKAQGKEALREAFWAMLNTFARGKRHCSMNQIIEGDGQKATMTSYLVVFNRNDLLRGGSALVTDIAEQKNGKWLLASRKIGIDPSLHFGPTNQEKNNE